MLEILKKSTDSLPEGQKPANPAEDTWVVSDENGFVKSFNNLEAAQIFEEGEKQNAASKSVQASDQRSVDETSGFDLPSSAMEEGAPNKESQSLNELLEVLSAQGEITPESSEPAEQEKNVSKSKNTFKP
ncbi:hypothetical protein [Pseudomonas sp. JAI120]|uniref:hypothetical protein n=1 Tax=Pseudomonas sp. JAI120 TaxID=2723063 RepID=UPI0030DB3D6E